MAQPVRRFPRDTGRNRSPGSAAGSRSSTRNSRSAGTAAVAYTGLRCRSARSRCLRSPGVSKRPGSRSRRCSATIGEDRGTPEPTSGSSLPRILGQGSKGKGQRLGQRRNDEQAERSRPRGKMPDPVSSFLLEFSPCLAIRSGTQSSTRRVPPMPSAVRPSRASSRN